MSWQQKNFTHNERDLQFVYVCVTFLLPPGIKGLKIYIEKLRKNGDLLFKISHSNPASYLK